MASSEYRHRSSESPQPRPAPGQTGSLPYPDDFDSIPDHRAYAIPSQQSEHDDLRSSPRLRQRATSNVQRPNLYPAPQPPAQPIFDAVNDAFDHSSAANQLPHDIIAQITEQVRSQVIDTLRAEGLAAAYQHHGPQTVRPEPRSQPDTFTAQSSFGNATNQHGSDGQPFESHQRHVSEAVGPGTRPSKTVNTPPMRDNRSSTGSAFADHDFSRASTFASSGGVSAAESDNADKVDLSGRYGDRSVDESLGVRPPPAPRINTNEEETVLEKMWQPLFDGSGSPTPRLSQFLRGLALYMIEDFEPKKSLVLLPRQLNRFYRKVQVESEPYDWETTFTKLSSSALSKIYQDLRLPHHFVHDTTVHPSQLFAGPPIIPALTPEGFSIWITLMIRADPDREFARLSQAVKNMPISNADDRKERFPKELSRRLFPRQPDNRIQMQVASALSGLSSTTHLRQNSYPPPPPLSSRPQRTGDADTEKTNSFHSGSEPSVTTIPERERNPYSSSGSSADRHVGAHAVGSSYSRKDQDLSSDADAPSPPQPSIQIERERKPYVAKEGTGKIYEDRPPFTAAYTESPMAMQSEFRDLRVPGRHGSDGHPDERSSSVAVDGRDSAHPPPPRTHGLHRDGLHGHPDDIETGIPRRTASKSSRRTKSPIKNPQVRSDNSIDHLPEEYYRESRRPTFENEVIRDNDHRRGGQSDHDRHYEAERSDRDGDRYRDDHRRGDDHDPRYRDRYNEDTLHRTRSSDVRPRDPYHQPHSTRHGSLADAYGNAPLGSGERRYG